MPIRIRLQSDSDPISSTIKWWTSSNWSHVDFAFKDGYLGARPTRGVQLRPLTYCNPKVQMFGTISLPDSKADAEFSQKVEDWARSKIGEPYDYIGILGFAGHINLHNTHRWFCSHFVIYACELYGVPLLNIDLTNTGRIDPGRLSLSTAIRWDKPIIRP
jgi:uncharacterized protein YycO